jgi:hypothetical protein
LKVGGRDRQGARGANQTVSFWIELESSIHTGNIEGGRELSN